MKVALAAVVGVIALIAIVTVVGALLPRTHRVTSRLTLREPPEAVWPAVRNLDALVGHWKELESAARLPDREGKEVWQQKAGGFELRLIVEEAQPPTRLVTRIDAPPDASFGGTWTYDLAPSGSGTTVTVTEDGYVSNPIFRVMMKVMGAHRTLDGFLGGLAARFGEVGKAEHVK